ncbi:permease [Paracoccus sp. M683]|uniref:permease n=1 Tax=Paracoccus sp. M683 TaxID=2594268 RepID=UPI00117E31B1|nr:permease [Paracoccus sp. M683]TRW96862.1 permease [Paracoccus sp. M683]
MNDMEWGGADTPEGPFAAIENVPETDRKAVRAAIERALTPNDLDEVNFASSLLWSYVADLERDWRAMKAGDQVALDADALKKAVKSAKDVREALDHLKQERMKVDKLRKDIAGGVGGGCLDLDAARDEIGRRLACLRRAG